MYNKNQENQDLCDSSVAVMLREMQREVNTGHPCGSKLHLDYSTNNHPPHLHAGDDLDCCFMIILSWGKPVGPRIMRKLWSKLTTGQSEHLREQTDDKKRETDRRQLARARSRKPTKRRPSGVTQRTPKIPWWHLQIMTFANLGESWSSKTGTSGYDQQICPGTFPSSWPFVKKLSRTIVQKTSEKWKAKEHKIEEAKKQKINKSDDEWNYADWQPSSWSWQPPTTWTSSSSSSWQQWSSDQTRESSDWRSSGSVAVLMAVRDLIYEDIYKGIHDDENNVWL